MENNDNVSYESDGHKPDTFLKNIEQELSREDKSMLRNKDISPYTDNLNRNPAQINKENEPQLKSEPTH